jgi:hypothetical protein
MKYFYIKIHYFKRIGEEEKAEAFPMNKRAGLS